MKASPDGARGFDAARLSRAFVVVVGAGLLLDGVILLVAAINDIGINAVHAVSGAALLVVSWFAWRGRIAWAIWAALIAGAFYVALGVVGLTIDRPLGLQPAPTDNIFHVALGLLGLLIGAWALRTAQFAPPVPSHNGALRPPVRNAPAVRRRAHRRPGKARGGRRRR